MNKFVAPFVIAASIVGSEAFAPLSNMPLHQTKLQVSATGDLPYFMNEVENNDADSVPSAFFASTKELEKPEPVAAAPVTPKKTPAAKKKKAVGGSHKEGLFSPVVIMAKGVMGEAELNKLRGKVIGMHSDIIGKFVDTHESPFGQEVLRALFTFADKNSNGTIEEEELAEALQAMGFDLKEKQIKGVFERADADSNGTLDLEEWMSAAPKTLRTNLIKLAKKNGGEMGLLA